MSDSLRSARAKLKRANVHTGTLKRELRRFFKTHPKPTFRGAFERDPTRCVIYIDRGYGELPDSFPARFGDAIHNYRCALDHVAWQLVKHGTDPNPKRPEDVQFPIYHSSTGFDNNRARRLPGVSDGPVKFIKSRHPYGGGKKTHNPLYMLTEFSNDDKHRSIQFLVTGVYRMQIEYWCQDCVAIGEFVQSNLSPVIEADAEVGWFPVEITGLNPQVDVKLALQSRISTEDRRRSMFFVLEEIQAEVEKVLNAPEILAGL